MSRRQLSIWSKAMRSCFSCVWLFATLWTVAHQAPLSTRFSRPEYWIGLPRLSPGVLPDPGIEPQSPALQADSLPLGHPESTPPQITIYYFKKSHFHLSPHSNSITKERLLLLYSIPKSGKCSCLTLCIEIHHQRHRRGFTLIQNIKSLLQANNNFSH